MLEMLIAFIKGIAQQNYESFVVYSDSTDLAKSNANVTEEEVAAGYFWDRNFESHRNLNELNLGFPCVGIERESRILSQREAKDYVWLTFSSSKAAEEAAGRIFNDPTRTYLFNQISAIVTLVTEADIVRNPSGNLQLLHPSQYEGQPDYVPVKFQPFYQEEDVTITWLNSPDRIITAGGKIAFKDCIQLPNLVLVNPPSTQVQGFPVC